MSVQTVPDLSARVWLALDTVRDPELDEPVTTLGFVASCRVEDGSVEVHLRLPTYFCAPNFAFLMVADAFDAVSAVDGVDRVAVVLDDHFASDTINAGVAARAGFVGTFGDEANDELDELRRGFLRKAVLAGTDRVCRPLRLAARTWWRCGWEISHRPPRSRRCGPGVPSSACPRATTRRSWSTSTPACRSPQTTSDCTSAGRGCRG